MNKCYIIKGQEYTQEEAVGLLKNNPTLFQELFEDLKKSGSPSSYINHSGGANGADTFFHIIGEKYGVFLHKHYMGEGTPLKSAILTARGDRKSVV